ncbi:MAG: WD40/YVTN/BNR-like repeat-containing protein [Stenotrophobium sp.]
MSQTDLQDFGGEHEREGSMRRGWPALLLTLIVLGAAIFAFSPRPLPPFPATHLPLDRMLLTGLAQDGSRLVAVGEQGHIVIADDPRGPWREAKIEPDRRATLSQVAFVGSGVALAVGQNDWILRSEDRGASWKEVHFDGSDQATTLLGLAGPFDGKLFVFGAFGTFLTSTDQGKTWTQAPLSITVPPPTAAEAAAAAAAADANPFADPGAAAAPSGSDLGTHHLYAMVRAANGNLILVGERGLLLRSVDSGKTWKPLPSIYKGSFFGALVLPSNRLLVFGMRGHAFYSTNNGDSWQASVLPNDDSLFGGAVTANGDVLLVDDSNTVLLSTDGGAHFNKISQGKRRSLAAILPEANGQMLTAGDGGMRLMSLNAGQK